MTTVESGKTRNLGCDEVTRKGCRARRQAIRLGQKQKGQVVEWSRGGRRAKGKGGQMSLNKVKALLMHIKTVTTKI